MCCLQVGHVEDVVVDDGYRGQKLGQRSAPCIVYLRKAPGIHNAGLTVCGITAGLLRPWSPMPKAKDATKSFWTAQTAMCHFMRNVASQGRRSRWSVIQHALHCKLLRTMPAGIHQSSCTGILVGLSCLVALQALYMPHNEAK